MFTQESAHKEHWERIKGTPFRLLILIFSIKFLIKIPCVVLCKNNYINLYFSSNKSISLHIINLSFVF